MSFMAAAGYIGLTGLGATLGAGAMMGATMGGVSNLVQGRGVFDNIGQNMLMGGAGAGIIGGLGSAMGGVGTEVPATVTGSNLAVSQSGANPLADASFNNLPASTYTPPPAVSDNPAYNAWQAQTTNPPPISTSPVPDTISPSPISNDPSTYNSPTSNPKATFLKNPADYMVQNPTTVAGMASGVASLFNKPVPAAEKAGPGGNIDKYGYSPAQYGPDGRAISQASYGTPTVTHYAAKGGPIRFAGGGEIYSDAPGVGPYSDSAGKGPYSDAAGKGPYSSNESGLSQQMSKVSPALLTRYANAAKNAAVQAAAIQELQSRSASVHDYGEETGFAGGGMASLPNEYAASGKLLQGPGDGMSDSIPAVIKGPRPQRAALAQGEFVIPADVVSHLGNGSTDAGSKRLYAMMDKIRHARTGNKKQGKQIDPSRFLPA